MTHDERLWWSILNLADTISEMCFREKNQERGLAAHNVANLARKTLRDEFKLNLDTLDEEARARFEALMTKEFEKADAEKTRMEQIDHLIEDPRALLAAIQGKKSPKT